MLQRKKVFIVLLVVLIAAVGNIFYNYKQNKQLENQACNLANGSCSMNLHGQAKMTFSVTPKVINSQKVALSMSLQTANMTAEKAKVSFIHASKDQAKGMQSFTLKSDSGGLFNGTGTLKVEAPTGKWVAMVIINTHDGQQYAVPMDLTLK